MQDLAQLYQLAAAQHRSGNLEAAEQGYRQILEQVPDESGVRRDLAWLLSARGDHAAAIAQLSIAIQSAPTAAELYVDVGTMLSKLGRVEDAIAALLRAVQLEPGNLVALFNLGNCHSRLGQLEQAVASYRAALGIAPDDVDVLLNLGVVQKDLGQIDEARQDFEQVLRLRPDSAEAWINLGLLAKLQSDYALAVSCCNCALQINPQSAIAFNNRGSALCSQGQLAAAIADYQQALAISPQYAKALGNLGEAYLDQGDLPQAVSCLEHAIAAGGGDALRIKAALAMPRILESQAGIENARRRIGEQLAELNAHPLSVADPVQDVGAPAFYLAYLGFNEREMQARIACIMREASPSLEFVAPHCWGSAACPTRQRLRVGFVSTNFYNHTIGKLNAGLIQQLDRQRFEVVVCSAHGRRDKFSELIHTCANESVLLAPQLGAARQQIADRKLDVLLYADIGMAPLTYYLAHARLAPVQCVTWGHPLTTGIPTVDYFISSEHLERGGSEDQYTETLVRLGNLTNYYFRPETPSKSKTRADFGLPDGVNLYVCPQSLFKLHPLDDEAWRQILERDPLGRIVLIEGPQPDWAEMLRRRFDQSLGTLAEHVVFIPRQSADDFVRLLAVADVLLDPLMFGGGNTSYEAFAVGTPVVTLPGEFLRNRITYALYRQMGVSACIAANVDEYVALAVRLATDPTWRQQVSDQILAAGPQIFENPAIVRELETFFQQAAAKRGAV